MNDGNDEKRQSKIPKKIMWRWVAENAAANIKQILPDKEDPPIDGTARFLMSERGQEALSEHLQQAARKVEADLFKKGTKIHAREELHQLFDAFLDRWLLVPPLVRASAGVNMMKSAQHQMQGLHRESEMEKVTPRRQMVTYRFIRAYGTVKALLAGLTNHADTRAVAGDIDADVWPIDPEGLSTVDIVYNNNITMIKHPLTNRSYLEMFEGAAKDIPEGESSTSEDPAGGDADCG